MNNNCIINQLVISAKGGNKEALEKLVLQLKPFILKTARQIFIKDYDMEDLIQIGYISLLNSIKKYNPMKNKDFLPYAMYSVKNNFNYEIRQKCRYNYEESLDYSSSEDAVPLLDTLASDELTDNCIIHKENISYMQYALGRLPYEDWEIINSVYMKGIKIKAFAEAKGLSYSTCVKRKKRALQKLKKLLLQKGFSPY